MNLEICKKCQEKPDLHVLIEKNYTEYNRLGWQCSLYFKDNNKNLNCICWMPLSKKCKFEEINPLDWKQGWNEKIGCKCVTEQLMDFYNNEY
jgi:hypothetical protein